MARRCASRLSPRSSPLESTRSLQATCTRELMGRLAAESAVVCFIRSFTPAPVRSYERSYPVNNNVVVPAGQGIVHFNLGDAGASLYTTWLKVRTSLLLPCHSVCSLALLSSDTVSFYAQSSPLGMLRRPLPGLHFIRPTLATASLKS
jgi:hypothetical protein